MTRRRNTVNIYDYPEHLNPFREDADDNCGKFNTTGRRRPAFANAWTMFSPSKGKSQTSEDIPPQTQPSAASRFMTWTPKLLRRSFRRSSNSSSSSPWDNPSHSSFRFSLRTPSSRSSLPPSGSSRTSLQSPPSSSPHRTTPPSRPAPPTFRPLLSPSNSHNVSNNVESNPVPPRRRALYTASSPEKTAGEKPSEDEVKYIQQGAKPKKKRRAPLPPQPSPIKSPEDSQQMNSHEVEVKVTSTATSNCIEEPTSNKESISASQVPEVKVEETEGLPEKENQKSLVPAKEETSQSCTAEDRPPEEHQQIEVVSESLQRKMEEPPPTDEMNKTDSLHTESNRLEEVSKSEEPEKHFESETNEKYQDVTKTEKETIVQDTTGSHLNGMNGRHNSDDYLKVDFDVVLHISEEDLRDKGNTKTNENQNHSTSIENGNMENEKENLDNKEQEDKFTLQNGGKALCNSEVLQNETQMNDKNINGSSAKVPEPKPRTILPIKD